MRWLYRLERKLGRWAIPNLTQVLVVGQVLSYVLVQLRPEILDRIALIPARVLQGEVWRLLTLIFDPPATALLWAFLFWYFFYFLGTALEAAWGAFRYNVYLAVGYLATVAVAFVTPEVAASNSFLYASVFLAFATLYPDYQIYLFFVLPIRVRWLALLMWLGYALQLVRGDWATRLALLASISNYLLFSYGEIWRRIKTAQRRMAAQTRQRDQQGQVFHRCRICGITDQTHPQVEFRYCSRCAGTHCYCPEHLYSHTHVERDTPIAGV